MGARLSCDGSVLIVRDRRCSPSGGNLPPVFRTAGFIIPFVSVACKTVLRDPPPFPPELHNPGKWLNLGQMFHVFDVYSAFAARGNPFDLVCKLGCTQTPFKFHQPFGKDLSLG